MKIKNQKEFKVTFNKIIGKKVYFNILFYSLQKRRTNRLTKMDKIIFDKMML